MKKTGLCIVLTKEILKSPNARDITVIDKQSWAREFKGVKTMPSTIVEENIFKTEIRRIDSDIGNIKKSIERQDDKFTRAFEKLEKNWMPNSRR